MVRNIWLNPRKGKFAFFALVIGLSCIFIPAMGITATFGSTIPLSGYASGTNTVYLFLTGPNLPSNGVALDNVNNRADQGYFTQVDVNSGKWSYKWVTQGLGTQLDSGTYTIWVVDSAVDRSNLAGADYSTIPVTFGVPSVSISTPTPVPTGSLYVKSEPSMSGVFLAETYYGTTPLEIGNLNHGLYMVTVAKYGYANSTIQATVVSGERTTVNVTLAQLSGQVQVNTNPSGANVTVDGVNSGTSPTNIGNLESGNHTISTNLAGYQPAETMVTLQPGETVSVNLSMSPVATTQKTGIPMYLVVIIALTGIAVSVCLFQKRY